MEPDRIPLEPNCPECGEPFHPVISYHRGERRKEGLWCPSCEVFEDFWEGLRE